MSMIITSLRNRFAQQTSPVLIYGASRAGLYHKHVFDELGVSVAGFIDSDPAKIGTVYLGCDVYSMNDAMAKFASSPVFVALMDASSVMDIQQTLRAHPASAGREIGYLTPDIVFAFLHLFSARQLNEEKFNQYKFELFNKNGLLRNQSLSPSFTLVVTEKCNLSCENCAAFVPQNDNPKTFSADDLIESVKSICASFEFVYRVCIMGGEPFIHKELAKIIESISAIDNLLFIDIATNGTVVPPPRALDVIKRFGVGVEVSDYGVTSRKMKEVFELCEEKGIIFYHQNYGSIQWGELGLIPQQKRSDADNSMHFLQCLEGLGTRNHVVDGKLHRCLFSAMVTRLGYIPDDPSDYVDMTGRSTNQLDEAVRELTFRTKPLSACDYCKGPGRVTVPAGIQTIK